MALLSPCWVPLKRVLKMPEVLQVYKRAGRGQGTGQGLHGAPDKLTNGHGQTQTHDAQACAAVDGAEKQTVGQSDARRDHQDACGGQGDGHHAGGSEGTKH